jgi:hypothetical protein
MKITQLMVAAGLAFGAAAQAKVQEVQFVLYPDIAIMADVVTKANVQTCLKRFETKFQPNNLEDEALKLKDSEYRYKEPQPMHFITYNNLKCAKYELFDFFTTTKTPGTWVTGSYAGNVFQTNTYSAYNSPTKSLGVVVTPKTLDGHLIITQPDRASIKQVLDAVASLRPNY